MGFSLKDFLFGKQAQPAQPKPTPKQQVRFNVAQLEGAFRDLFDANTAKDQANRLSKGQPRLYADQQRAMGNMRPNQNVGQLLFGNSARLVNTVQGAQRTLAELPRQELAMVTRNKAALEASRNRAKGNFKANGGALNAGSAFTGDQLVNNPSQAGLQLSGTVVGAGGELVPVPAAKALKGANLGIKALKVAGVSGLAGAGADAGNQLIQKGKIDPRQSAEAFATGAAFGGALPVAGAALSKAAQPAIKGLKKANYIRPSNLTDNEVLDLFKLQADRGGFIEQDVYEKGIRAAKKAGIDYRDQSAIDRLIKQHYAYDMAKQNRKEAIKTALKPTPLNQGGYVRNPLGKDGAPIEKTPRPEAQKPVDPIIKEYADMLRQAESGLKAGLQKVDDGTYAGTYTRVSEHTPFFRDFYAKNGKKPTIADWQKEAERQLKNGSGEPSYVQMYRDSQNPEINSLLQQADNGALTPQDGGFNVQEVPQPRVVISEAQKPNTATSKATKTQVQAPEAQKTPQTQPNLAQATDMAGGSTIGKEKLPQQKEQVTGTAQTSQSSGSTYSNSKQQRGFKVNISKDSETPLSVYKDIPGYNVKPNAKTIGSAAKRVSKDPEGTYNRLLENGIQKTEDSADALVLLRNLVENDELDKAGKLAQATAKAGTDFGQAVQIFSAFRKTTPDGALRDAWNIVNAYNTKNPKKAPIRITKEQSQKIVDLATDLQKTEYGTREWAVKAALLEREKGLLTPNTFLSKVSTVQTMAQLLNPKTAIRNILGNGVLDLAEDLVRLPATGIDKALKGLGFIDQRNMVVPSMKTNWANKLLGFKQGVEDVNLGIRTQGATGNYDLTKEVFKPGSIGNKLEKLLGYELSSMDKAFYTGRYQSSLENMMKAQKVKAPTPEMKATAEAEALYATFQNNSNLSIGLQKAKNAMNAGKEWGLGDFILKYPKTPGNIVNVGLDYSPVGFIKGLKSLHDGIKLKNIQDIRGGELLISRGLVGTGLIAGGAFLAKQGIISGKQDGDYDKSAADRDLGKGPFTFNITALGRLLRGEDTKPRPGDVTANYDWLQPNAIQLSMGANMIINSDSATQQINTNLESLGAGVDTITEQPVFRGVKEFVGDLNTQQGGGLGKATQGVATNAMSSFVPSIVNQVGQQFDNTKRATYGQTPFEEATNKVKGRIPGARNTLYPSLNTLGKEQSQYDVGGNNPFNVFINPAFLNRVKDEPALKEADALNQRTGETSQYPRSLTGKQTIDGVKTKLTAQQLYDLKKSVGQTTDEVFRGFINSPAFQAKSDEEKVKLLSGALTDVNAAGRAELAAKNELGQYAPNFTGKPTKLSTGAKQILSNGALEYVNSKLAEDSKPKTVKIAKAKAPKKTKSGRKSSGRSRSVKVARAKLPRLKTTFKTSPPKSPKIRVTKLKNATVKLRKPAKVKIKAKM